MTGTCTSLSGQRLIWIKIVLSSTRLRRSVKDYDESPWFLTYAMQKRLVDLRDEALVLRDDEVTGQVPLEVEYEEYQKVNNDLSERISSMLKIHKEQGTPIHLGVVLKDYLAQLTPEPTIFDLARIVIDQAVRLGYSESDYRAIQPDWHAINQYGAKGTSKCHRQILMITCQRNWPKQFQIPYFQC